MINYPRLDNHRVTVHQYYVPIPSACPESNSLYPDKNEFDEKSKLSTFPVSSRPFTPLLEWKFLLNAITSTMLVNQLSFIFQDRVTDNVENDNLRHPTTSSTCFNIFFFQHLSCTIFHFTATPYEIQYLRSGHHCSKSSAMLQFHFAGYFESCILMAVSW